MRILRWLGALVLLLLALVATHLVLVESGEVVVLETRDAAGETHATRLWFVEHEGASWVTAGAPDAAWLARIASDPRVEARSEDGGPEGRFEAVAVPEARAEILERMAAKYGFADRWVRAVVGRDAVPVRLAPIESP